MSQTTVASRSCCTEYAEAARLSRRRFLGGMAAAGGTALVTSVFGDAVRQASFAAGSAGTGNNVMVVISFRGGIDGMGLVVPHGDPDYYAARRSIAVPKSSLLAADAMFGLHPKMQPLQWLWDAGELAAVQAVGMPVPNRSHFQAMELIEDADPGSSLRQGWVNRMAGLTEDPAAAGAVHLGAATPPTIIEGPAPSVATTTLRDIQLSAFDGEDWQARRRAHVRRMWAPVGGAAGKAASSALETVDVLGSVAKTSYAPKASYPSFWPARNLAEALKDTAKLIKADVGTEVVSVDFGSWDFHDGYGPLGWGSMQTMVGAFAAALSAFMEDLGALRSRVTVVTISEFGRRVAENGNGGLDHGWGNMMLLAGAGVRGGRYYGSWPGLGSGKQVDGDLAVTTDYRQVLGEVVHTRFPGKDVTKVFPGVSYSPLGVLRSS